MEKPVETGAQGSLGTVLCIRFRRRHEPSSPRWMEESSLGSSWNFLKAFTRWRVVTPPPAKTSARPSAFFFFFCLFHVSHSSFPTVSEKCISRWAFQHSWVVQSKDSVLSPNWESWFQHLLGEAAQLLYILAALSLKVGPGGVVSNAFPVGW